MMKLILQIVGILLVISIIVWVLCDCSPIQLQYDYTEKISVDKPDKIETVISNAMSDLRRRDFVPVNLAVKWYPAIKTYKIYASGIDRAKLENYEP